MPCNIVDERLTSGRSAWIGPHRLRPVEHTYAKGKSILCRECLSRQLAQSSISWAQHRLDFPAVSCEHCRKVFSLPRQRLDALRHRGRPILCSTCLPKQLKEWQRENTEYGPPRPLVACLTCARRFQLTQETLDQLIANGRAAFCPTCLPEAPGKRLDGKNESLAKTISYYPKM